MSETQKTSGRKPYSKNTVVLSISLPRELQRAVSKKASALDLSVSRYLRGLIQKDAGEIRA